MRETVISAKRKKAELYWLLGSFLAAVLVNIVAIIVYHSPWKEIYSTLHIVLPAALFIYVLLLVIRLMVYAILRLTGRYHH